MKCKTERRNDLQSIHFPKINEELWFNYLQFIKIMHFITESKPNLQETVCIVRFLHLAFYNYGSLAVKTNSSVCFARLMICSSGFIIRRNKILRRGAKVESTSSTKFPLQFLTLSVQNTSLIVKDTIHLSRVRYCFKICYQASWWG